MTTFNVGDRVRITGLVAPGIRSRSGVVTHIWPDGDAEVQPDGMMARYTWTPKELQHEEPAR